MARTLLNVCNGNIGDFRESMLTLIQFQAINGPGWVLANGQSCVGSYYEEITGNTTVPDARGTVIRGKDNGSGRNSSGDTALGTYQSDQNKSHAHGASSGNNSVGHSHAYTDTRATWFVPTRMASIVGGANAVSTDPGNATDNLTTGGESAAHSHAITVNSDGGSEALMKNTTANIFIKIN